MALRELLLSLGVEVDQNGVRAADGALSKMKKAAKVAAAAFAALKAFQGINNVVDGVRGMGDELDKTSKQLGISTDALQEWRFAAGLAGVEGNEMSNSLGKLQKNAFEAVKGNKTLREDFRKLGVDLTNANGEVKNGDELLVAMAEGMANLDNDTEKVALSMNLMGRSGRKLLPLLNEGASGIEAMRAEAQSLGGVMSQDLIDATVQLTDDQFRAQQAWQGVKNDIAQALIPAYLALAHATTAVAKAIRGPLKVAFGIFKNIASVFIDGAEELNKIFDGLGTALLALIPILGSLGIAVVLFSKKAVWGAIKTAASWAIAALPFLAIAAIIALLLLAIDDFITFMKGGDSVIGRLVNRFKKWVREMGGITGAVGKMFEMLFKRIFGLSDDTATKVGAVFAALAAVVRAIFVKFPTWLAENLAQLYLDTVQFGEDFKDVIVRAIDFVVGKFEKLTDAVADAIGVVADFVGLGDEDIEKNARAIDRAQAKVQRERKEANEKRVRILQQLEAEGFGTFTRIAETETTAASVGLTGAKAGAEARFAELNQDIHAPLTVNVDATNRDDAAQVGRVVADKVSKTRDYRQAAQAYSTR